MVSKSPLVLYLTPGGVDPAMELIVHELHRRGTPKQVALAAFDELVDGYNMARGPLARFKVGFERPADTADLRAQIAESLATEGPSA